MVYNSLPKMSFQPAKIFEWASKIPSLASGIPVKVITGTSWDYLIIVAIGTSAVALYIHHKIFPSNNYWEKQDVSCYNPGIREFIRDALRQDIHNLEMERYEKYGRIYGRYDGAVPVLTIGDPDVLKNTIVKDSQFFVNRRFFQVGDPVMDNFLSALMDDDWKRVRHVLTPSFTVLKLKQMRPKINVCVKRVIASLESTLGSNKPADLQKLFSAFAMDVIASCAFGAKISSLDSPEDPFVMNARKLSGAGKRYATLVAQFCPVLLKLLGITIFDKKAGLFFRNFVLEIIEERRKKTDVTSVDFLQLLLEATKSEESSILGSTSEFNVESTERGKLPSRSETKYVTDEELISQCVMFFFAGYDTVSSLLQVTMYHLAQNEDVQQRLYEEISETLGDKEAADYEDIANLKYLDAVVSEGLRITSSCIRMERQVKEDYVIKDLGIKLKKGQLVSLPFYCIHHDPEHYPDPYKFDPERFMPEEKSQRHSNTFVPFGIGIRSCIGNRFAVMECKLCILLILKNFKLTSAPNMKRTLSGSSKLGQYIPEKVLVNIEPRV